MTTHCRKFSQLVAAAGIALLCANVSLAATANTIRGAYGVALTQDIVPLKEELSRVQRAIHTAQEIELYNEVMTSMDFTIIDSEIESLTVKADDLRKSVICGIDLPLETLIRYEAEYHDTVSELNSLLSARDYYMPKATLVPDEDLATLLNSESALKTSIAGAGYYEDIGELTYYPVIGIAYHVNSPFGSRYDPLGEKSSDYHYGIDLRAPQGTPVGAWFSGTVSSTGTSYGSGNYVWIDHGYGVKSFYCHLSRIDVEVGQQVTQGTQIALSGNTGRYTTGPHLHLGLYIGGTAVDPKVILG